MNVFLTRYVAYQCKESNNLLMDIHQRKRHLNHLFDDFSDEYVIF